MRLSQTIKAGGKGVWQVLLYKCKSGAEELYLVKLAIVFLCKLSLMKMSNG